jgi:hypothetical protein
MLEKQRSRPLDFVSLITFPEVLPCLDVLKWVPLRLSW